MVPPRRCRTGACRWRSAPTSMTWRRGSAEAGLRASRGSGEAKGRRQRRRAGARRCTGEALRRRSDRRSGGARAGLLGCDGRAVEEVPGRSRRRDALRGEHDEPASVAALHEGRHAEPGTDEIVADARRCDAARSESPRRESLLHPRRRSVEDARARSAQAGRLETLVPGAGHLVHMPAHIYIRTGQYAKSAKSNADAAAVDEKYFKATGAKRTSTR